MKRATSHSTRRHRTANGRIIDVEMAQHHIDFDGYPAALVVLTDVTSRRQLEAQLRQAQKMESVGMLAGGVAHDFNNLLTIISGYSQLILNTLKPGDPNHYSAEQILKAGERAAALTQQLLDFSRPQVLQPKVLDLNKLVTGLSTMLRRLIGEDIDLQLVLRADLGMVSADPGQIEQVLMNLVVNARDAMPKGGTLTIETANVQLGEGYTGRHLAVRPGPYAQIAVSDNGGGMDEATQARLFEPFFTTKGVGPGNGAGALHGVGDREAERREPGRIQRAQPRDFGEGLSATHRSAGGGGSRVAAQRGDVTGRRRSCWWKMTRWCGTWCARPWCARATR